MDGWYLCRCEKRGLPQKTKNGYLKRNRWAGEWDPSRILFYAGGNMERTIEHQIAREKFKDQKTGNNKIVGEIKEEGGGKYEPSLFDSPGTKSLSISFRMNESLGILLVDSSRPSLSLSLSLNIPTWGNLSIHTMVHL